MTKSKSDKPRKRIRKPKYLSLHHLHRSTTTTAAADHQNHLINLFPTQPGTTKTSTSTASPPDDKDHDNNMAHFFSAADSCTTTLTGLLTAPTSSLSPEINEPGSPTSISAYSGRDSSLARTALRSREREEEEEEEIRWVRLSEVVGERKAAEEEVSSRAVAEGEEVWWLARRREGGGGGGGGLSLKLDYKEVSEAWCGIGRPFWRVAGAGVDETPQTVPDLQLVQDDLNVANGGLWRVPNQTSYVGYGKEEHGGEAIEVPKVRQREASVLRYKEKRMNRLFSKQIRYQVRKLNAEKRPRVKGRFVKRS